MTDWAPRMPTVDECSANAEIPWRDGWLAFAIWYPQMGGYSGRAVAVRDSHKVNSCWDVFVWHDGEFPFDESGNPDGVVPRIVHHCDAEQFVAFGKKLMERSGEVG